MVGKGRILHLCQNPPPVKHRTMNPAPLSALRESRQYGFHVWQQDSRV